MTLEERATEILRNDKRLKALAREAVVQAIHEIWDVGMEAPVKKSELSNRDIEKKISARYKTIERYIPDPFLPS